MHPTSDKLSILRSSMLEKETDAYIIPDTDPHLGEYIPDHWKIIEWLTGFTGSAGTVIITRSFAGLWTDSRYVVQAEAQLKGSEFVIIQSGRDGISNPASWLAENLERRGKVGLDGRLFSISRLRKLKQVTSEKCITFDLECDFITQTWSDRPPMPDSYAFEHPVEFAGRDRETKIRDVRNEMSRIGVSYQLLASPDDIMWLLNIRGKDLNYSPLLMCFAIVGMEQILLFAREDRIPFALAREFDRLGIVVLPYEEAAAMISTLSGRSGILISPSFTSVELYYSIRKLRIREGLTIPARMKAVKNSVETANIGKVMIRDGVAMTRFFFGIERDHGAREMSELSLGEELLKLRSEQENFLGLSFATIIAYNAHAAMPHYTATPESNSIVGPGLLLVDSGSQYLDGTTDITRTICLGNPTGKQKRDFTLVLKGMISLAKAVFPSSTSGCQLDTLARRALWEDCIDFGHGTGHGVGFCLNVHEGPQRISPAAGRDNENIMKPGMLTSNEPAVYRQDEYGIRTENLILCYEDEETQFGRFLRFSTVTLCYIDKKLIDKSMLEPGEISWLNRYHEEVYEKLSPYLKEDEREWLRIKTEAII